MMDPKNDKWVLPVDFSKFFDINDEILKSFRELGEAIGKCINEVCNVIVDYFMNDDFYDFIHKIISSVKKKTSTKAAKSGWCDAYAFSKPNSYYIPKKVYHRKILLTPHTGKNFKKMR